MPLVDTVEVRQPARDDVVGRAFVVAGVGGGFEGTLQVRVTADDREVARTFVTSRAGGVGAGDFSGEVRLDARVPDGTRLVVRVTADRGGPGDRDADRVTVTCFPHATGFLVHEVERGDTVTGVLRGLADLTVAGVDDVVAANPALTDPDVIEVGQRLTIPLLPVAR